MYIKVIFYESGVPKTGLSPTVDIYNVADNALSVNDGAMTEIGGGFYKYSFAGYSAATEYVFVADSVTLTGNERYATGNIEQMEGESVSILADTNELQGNQSAWATAVGFSTHSAADVKTAIEAGGSSIALIKAVTDALTSAAATKLATSAGTIVTGTVSHDNTASSTTIFYCDDITEATADHFNGRIVIFTSGALQYQATDITAYALETGEGKFTVTALTEAPADNVTFIIV